MSSVPFFISLLLIVAASAHAQPPDPLGAARDLMVAGQWHEALEAYGEIIAKGETPAKAIAHNNSCVALNNLADYTAALEQCRAAIRLRRQLGDDARTARTLNNLAIALRYLGRFDEATLTYHEALAINQRLGDLEAQAINRQNLGAVEIEAGHYGAALATFAAVEALAADHSAEPWAERQAQLARFNRGVVLEKLGAYREALDLYRQLAADEAGLDAAHRVALRVNLGVIYRNLGDPVQAVSAFEAAAAEADTLGDTAALSNALLNLGLAWHLNLGQAEKAENAYRGALELARQSGDRSEEIQDLFYLGRLLRESGRLAEAQEFFQRCLEVSDAAGSAEGRWSALAGLGRSANDDGHPHDALRYLQQAIEQIETVRASLDGGALRSGYFGDKRPVYAAAIDILTELDDAEPGQGHLEQALELVQRTKARELLDSLGTPRRARDTGGVPQPLIAEDLRRLVTAGGPVLEYFLGESALYVWVIREQSIRLHRLGDGQAIFEEAATVHRTLASRQAPLDERLRRLARALLPDSTIEAHDSSLRIAPDGALHYLPFEILPSPVGDLPAPLVERFEITYLPSASALGRLDNEGPSSDWLFAGFGDPEP
ncbi:MAG: tetratricopeptide repeat protein, partial [Acidobacteriota bacterium]